MEAALAGLGLDGPQKFTELHPPPMSDGCHSVACVEVGMLLIIGALNSNELRELVFAR